MAYGSVGFQGDLRYWLARKMMGGGRETNSLKSRPGVFKNRLCWIFLEETRDRMIKGGWMRGSARFPGYGNGGREKEEVTEDDLL